MSKFILKERAYFWPAHITVPRGSYAPNEVTFGTISLHKNGQARVRLDGLLPGDQSSLSKPDRNCSVAGKIFDDGRCILMLDAWNKDYTCRTHNIHHEDYESLCTIIADAHIEDIKDAAKQSSHISLPFGNFEEWLLEHSIETKRTKKRVTAAYTQRQPIEFDINGGKIRLISQIYGPWLGKSQVRSLKIEQKSRLEIIPSGKMDAAKVIKIHRHFHDFLIMVTNQ